MRPLNSYSIYVLGARCWKQSSIPYSNSRRRMDLRQGLKPSWKRRRSHVLGFGALWPHYLGDQNRIASIWRKRETRYRFSTVGNFVTVQRRLSVSSVYTTLTI